MMPRGVPSVVFFCWPIVIFIYDIALPFFLLSLRGYRGGWGSGSSGMNVPIYATIFGKSKSELLLLMLLLLSYYI